MPKNLYLKEELTDEELDYIGKTYREKHNIPLQQDGESNIGGIYLDEEHYCRLFSDNDINIFKPDGEPLIIFRKKILSSAACNAAYPALRKAATEAGNRGMAAGLIKEDEWKIFNRPTIKATEGARVRQKPIKKDGTLSNTSYGKNAPSGIIGFMDRNSRFPYCRTTAFNMDQPEKFARAMPLIRQINKAFAENCPERYATQLDAINKTAKDFVIPKTVFTTVTVNRSFRTATHMDKGDFKGGFGVMTALRAGNFTGCNLIFPKYRVAVNIDTRDLLLADVHQWHGNSPIIGISGQYERISLVLYMREGMIHCGTSQEEGLRAQKRVRGDKLW